MPGKNPTRPVREGPNKFHSGKPEVSARDRAKVLGELEKVVKGFEQMTRGNPGDFDAPRQLITTLTIQYGHDPKILEALTAASGRIRAQAGKLKPKS